MTDELRTGSILGGRYHLEAPLGQGGFGSVWRATHLPDGAAVAIKVLKPGLDDRAHQRFAREARALGRVRHHNCVEFIEFFIEDGRASLVTELVSGESLRSWQRGSHTVGAIVDVLRQIAIGLQAAHREGVIHRDLKPSNIMVCGEPGAPVVKLLDFGLAKLIEDRLGDITQTGEVWGTPGYMSPEQLRGVKSIGPPSDLYCLGVIAFELLERRRPYSGDSPLELAMKHLIDPVPSVGEHVPAAVGALISDLMAKDPAQRPPTAGAVIARLNSRERPRLTADRSKLVGGLALGLIAAAAAAAALVVTWSREPPPAPPAPLRTAAPTSLVRADEPMDLGSPVALGPALCGQPVTAGARQDVSLEMGLEKLTLRTYIPTSYDRTRKHPVLIVFHGKDGSGPDGILDEIQRELQPIADQHGLILVAPDGRGHDLELGYWSPPMVDALWPELRRLGEVLCVDEDAFFVSGHGWIGGEAAHQISCHHDPAGVITSAYRYGPRPDRCEGHQQTVPRLDFEPVGEEATPREGIKVDNDVGWIPTSRMSLRGHQDQLLDRNRCSKERPTVKTWDTSFCKTWRCEVPVTTCEVDGGRKWPGPPVTHIPRPPVDLPYGEVLWEFIEQVRSSNRMDPMDH